jgi:arylsulfatase A-like enzyme
MKNKMKHNGLRQLFLFFIIVICSAYTITYINKPSKPNIVVIFVDDLGTADVSCLSNGIVKTPNIDRLAQKGVKFTTAYVPAPLCGPSRAALFTGIYPQRFGFINNGGGIPTTQKLLPSILKEAGYRTALIGKWHSKGPMPHQRGCFDETLCSPTSSPFIDYFQPTLARNGKVEESTEYSTDLFAREASEFMERNKSKPFALTVTFNAPHIRKVVKNAQEIAKEYDAALAQGKTLDVPMATMARVGEAAKFTAQFPNDKARAEVVATIDALDQGVGRILDKLEELGIAKNTIVFFASDHGAHPENRSENLPLRDYKWSVYEGGIRTPMFAVYPNVFPAGLVYSNPVSTMDIFTTCIAHSGAKNPLKLDGIDLTPFLKSKKKTPPHDALFAYLNGFCSVRKGDWKLVLTPQNVPQLFNLKQDISEKNNLAATDTATTAALQKLVLNWQIEVGLKK